MGVFYRPPNQNHSSFIANLESLLNALPIDENEAIIMGDFNFDFGKKASLSSTTKTFQRLMRFFGLQQIIKKPTRITEYSRTLIDLCSFHHPSIIIPVLWQLVFQTILLYSTRVTRTSATLIDLFFTNNPENISNSGVIHLGISDHSMIFAVKNITVPKFRNSTREVRDYKNVVEIDFIEGISQVSWNIVCQFD